MERKVNYLLVGAFALALVAALVAFVLWAHGRSHGRAQAYYSIYFSQAINGLVLGGNVRYLGVDVGTVQAIDLDVTAGAPRVHLTIGIDAKVPVSQATVATLKPSGITGVSFIDLDIDAAQATPLVAADGELPVIRSESSGMDVLFSGANDTMQRVNMLLSNENLAHISKTFSNLESISHRMDALLAKHDATLNHFLGPDLDELGRTIIDAHAAVKSLKSLSDSLNNHPSELIFGK